MSLPLELIQLICSLADSVTQTIMTLAIKDIHYIRYQKSHLTQHITDINLMQWAVEVGCPVTDKAIHNVILRKDFTMVNYLRTLYPEVHVSMLYASVVDYDLCVSFMTEIPYDQIDSIVFSYYLGEYGQKRVIQHIHDSHKELLDVESLYDGAIFSKRADIIISHCQSEDINRCARWASEKQLSYLIGLGNWDDLLLQVLVKRNLIHLLDAINSHTYPKILQYATYYDRFDIINSLSHLIHSNTFSCRSIQMCELVSKYGGTPTLDFKADIDTYRWAASNKISLWDEQCKFAEYGKLKHLKYIHSIGTPLIERLDWYAVYDDHVEVLVWLKSINYTITENTFKHAIERRSTHCIQYLMSINCPTNSMCFYTAVGYGMLDVVKWLHMRNCPHLSGLVNHATTSSRTRVATWLSKNGY